jgi:hypothetical protein
MRRSGLSAGITFGVFAIAFAVRFLWALRVQSPLTAVYSDMGGYVGRARGLLDGTAPDIGTTLYPWGAHCFIALEMAVFGRDAPVAIAGVHALVGAVPAACMVPLTLRLVPNLTAAAAVGLLVALWQPQIVYVGFFLSEIWFSALIAVHALLSARRATGGARSFSVGLLSAVAFVVRPQFLVTWLVDTSAHVVSRYRRRGLRAAAIVLAGLAVPMLVAIAVSSVRLHRLSGQWGLISENANLNRLFADTDVCRVETTYTAANGARVGWHFKPPAKVPCDEDNVVRFVGFVGDARILEPIRRSRLRGVSLFARVERALQNVGLLAAKNDLFPEGGYEDLRWRAQLLHGFASGALYGVLPLCAIGLVLGRPDRLKFLTLANFGAVAVAAARYYGESRYRVPYDPFAILFAVVGLHELGARAGTLRRRLRAGRAGPPSRPAGPRPGVVPSAAAYAEDAVMTCGNEPNSTIS